MKSHLHILTLSSLLFFTLLSSCTQENTPNIAAPAAPAGAEFLNRTDTPTFLYQYEERNTTTGEVKGWVIDNQGNLRSYDKVSVRLLDRNIPEVLEAFWRETKLEKAVDAETLVANYKKNTLISRLSVDVTAANLSPDINKTYYSYSMASEDNVSHDHCNTGQSDYNHYAVRYDRSILLAQGDLIISHQNKAALEVLDYLKSFNLNGELGN